METVLGGRYRLIDVIGEGGTSVVWRAHDELLDRDVAAKVLRERGDERFRSSIRAEAKAAARLTNPRIAHIYDYGEYDPADGGPETDGSDTGGSEAGGPVPYLVMELVVGEPLSSRLDGGVALPWRRAAAIGAQIAEALLAAHALGLVHRDIKPDNVILTGDGVKLIDFGISALVGAPDMDEHGRLLGTAAYVAPERLADAPVGVAADVYSLGVLLHRMLSGTIPWETDSRTQLLAAHMFVAPRPLPPIDGMPPRLAALTSACIDKEPGGRPAIATLAAELGSLAGAGATTATRPVPVPAVGSAAVPAVARTAAFPAPDAAAYAPGTVAWPRHRSGMWLAAAGGVAALVVAAIVAWNHIDGPSADPATAADATCTAEFAMTRDTGAGFAAKLFVTSTVATGTPSWSVGFGFAGDQRLTDRSASFTIGPGDSRTRTAAVRQTGGAVTISGAGRLAARESLTIALTGTYRTANPIPTVVGLNGHACGTTVNGAATPPTSAAHPSGSTTTGPSAGPATPTASTTPSPAPGPVTPTPTPTPTPSDSATGTPSTGGHGSTGPGDGGGPGPGSGGGPGPGGGGGGPGPNLAG
jgi:serine/threonine-protein kinase